MPTHMPWMINPAILWWVLGSGDPIMRGGTAPTAVYAKFYILKKRKRPLPAVRRAI